MKNTWINLSVLLCLILLFGAVVESAAQKEKRSKKSRMGEREQVETEKLFIEAEKYFIIDDYTKAYQLFSKALDIDPENAAIHYKIAEILNKGDDKEKALFHATKAVELGPDNKYYYITAAQIHTELSNFEEAARYYEEMVKNIPKTEDYLFDLAALYLYQKDYDNALRVYRQAMDHYGKMDEIIYQIQQIYLKQNKLDEAIQEGVVLIESYPDEPEYVLRLSEILISNNRADQAIPYLEGFLDKQPENGRIALILFGIYKDKGEDERAGVLLENVFSSTEISLQQKFKILIAFLQNPDPEQRDYVLELTQILIDTHPDEANAYAMRGDVYFQYDEKLKAREEYLRALELDGSNFNVWQNVIQIEAENNEMDNVRAHAEQALEYFPNQASLYYYLGTASLIQKDHQGAVEAFEQARRLSAGNRELLGYIQGQLGDSYNSLKDYAKSDASYEAALEIDPNNDHVLNNYSYFLSLREEKLEKAKKMSAKLVKRNPENPTFLDTHAWVLYKNGDYQESLKYMERALENGDPKGTLLEHYGDILFKLGRVEDAVIQWKKAKGMDDTSELIDKKIADRKLYEN